ncbi:MAG: hypothetical protein MR992_00150 [Lachnospiraceae bacterium]|nr:hypothetical protein [Lachnospiraceae bacterium]MCI7191351.1 hypothetical protein [Lachnospiraceae bacterium]MDD7627593.1 hypothetical protein [Lachnospiraceae bacterium]MDY4120264.1 hypothetical protein [Lachnospiraceae bacterium]
MYYVPDGTQMCGYYECSDCKNRFLSLKIVPQLVCPYCGEEPDMELGPDEEMPEIKEAAKLIQVVSGKEEVEKMDTLLSLAITGGNYDWL